MRAVGEHAAHLLYYAGVEEDGLIVAEDVSVAAVEGALHLGVRHFLSVQLEGVAHVEGAAGRVGHLHRGNDHRDRVHQLGQRPLVVDLPSEAAQLRRSSAEEVQDIARLVDEPALGVLARLEADLSQLRERGHLRVHVPHEVAQQVFGIRQADLLASCPAAHYLVAVVGADLHAQRSARAVHVQVDYGLAGNELEEILRRRYLHLDLLSQERQIHVQEVVHHLAPDDLVLLVEALEGLLEDVGEREEAGRAVLGVKRFAPYESLRAVDDEAVGGGDVLERHLREREQLELAALLVVLGAHDAADGLLARHNGEDVEEVWRREVYVALCGAFTDIF